MTKNIPVRPDILFVINDFEFFKTHRLGLIEFLKEKGKNIAVVTDLRNASAFDLQRMDNNNIALINFNFDRASINPILNSYYFFKLFRLLFKLNPKKLSLISAKPAVLGGLCSLFLSWLTHGSTCGTHLIFSVFPIMDYLKILVMLNKYL